MKAVSPSREFFLYVPMACSVSLAGNWLFVGCQGTSMCWAPSRQHPVGLTRLIHQGQCWLFGRLGTAHPGLRKCRATFGGGVAFFPVIVGLEPTIQNSHNAQQKA